MELLLSPWSFTQSRIGLIGVFREKEHFAPVKLQNTNIEALQIKAGALSVWSFGRKRLTLFFVPAQLFLGDGLQLIQFRLQFLLGFLVHAVNEQNAVQVIRFVLDGAGQ